MSDAEMKEVPKAIATPETAVESRESQETRKTAEQPESAAFESPVQEPPPKEISFGSPVTTAPAPAPVKDAGLMKVERILEENLGDVYFNMPADVRAKFKAKGEEAAVTLRGMIEEGKAKARAVLQIILEWLRIIPKINKYYLDQEAKIKTDRIMMMIEDRRREKETQI